MQYYLKSICNVILLSSNLIFFTVLYFIFEISNFNNNTPRSTRLLLTNIPRFHSSCKYNILFYRCKSNLRLKKISLRDLDKSEQR